MTTASAELLAQVARAICESRTCEGAACCQWPANGGRTNCPVEKGGYDDAAQAAITTVQAAVHVAAAKGGLYQLAEAWVDAACAQLRGAISREEMRAARAAYEAALTRVPPAADGGAVLVPALVLERWRSSVLGHGAHWNYAHLLQTADEIREILAAHPAPAADANARRIAILAAMQDGCNDREPPSIAFERNLAERGYAVTPLATPPVASNCAAVAAEREAKTAAIMADMFSASVLRALDSTPPRTFLYVWEQQSLDWLKAWRENGGDAPICAWTSHYMRYGPPPWPETRARSAAPARGPQEE
jgi:hypothetical protein